MSRQETPFFLILLLIIAVIGAGVLFGFYQQARTDANVAATSQFVAETRRETAVLNAQIASTGQAFAEWGQATAIAVAQLALTGQAQSIEDRDTAVSAAETKQARAEADESTAVAQANLAGTAQALAEATAEAALDHMLDAATVQALAQENEATAVTNAEAAVGTANALATEQTAALDTIAALQGDLATLQYSATLDTIVNATQRALVPIATATPSDSSAVETPAPSSVRYVTSSGNLGFEYPETWIVQEQSGDLVVIVNNEAARTGESFGEDEFFLAMFPISAPDSFDIARATAVYAESVAENIGQGAPASFDDPETLSIGGRSAGRVHGMSEAYEAVVYMVHFEEESSVIVMMGMAAPGELTQFEPAMREIAASLSYVAPAPTARP